MERAAAGSTQPVPVVGMITGALRSNAWVRCSSLSNSPAAVRRVGGLHAAGYGSVPCRPAIELGQLLGVRAGRNEVTALIPEAVPPAKVTGLPDLPGGIGWMVPGRVWRSVLVHRAGAGDQAVDQRPSTTVMTSATTMAVTMNFATSSLTCQRLIKYRANTLTASIRTRDTPATARRRRRR